MFLDQVKSASELWGIKEISPFYIAYLGCMINGTNRGRELTDYLNQLRESKNLGSLYSDEVPELIKEAQQNGIDDWVKWDREPFSMLDIIPRYPVIIDLDQDDETLKLAFDIWLTGVRSEIGKAPKPISNKDCTGQV